MYTSLDSFLVAFGLTNDTLAKEGRRQSANSLVPDPAALLRVKCCRRKGRKRGTPLRGPSGKDLEPSTLIQMCCAGGMPAGRCRLLCVVLL